MKSFDQFVEEGEQTKLPINRSKKINDKKGLISQNACDCGNRANERTVSRFYFHHKVLSIVSRVDLQHTPKRPNSTRSHVLQCPDNVVDC